MKDRPSTGVTKQSDFTCTEVQAISKTSDRWVSCILLLDLLVSDILGMTLDLLVRGHRISLFPGESQLPATPFFPSESELPPYLARPTTLKQQD